MQIYSKRIQNEFLLTKKFLAPDPIFDDTGAEKYRLICKEHNIVPISRVLKSLATLELDSKVNYKLYYN